MVVTLNIYITLLLKQQKRLTKMINQYRHQPSRDKTRQNAIKQRGFSWWAKAVLNIYCGFVVDAGRVAALFQTCLGLKIPKV